MSYSVKLIRELDKLEPDLKSVMLEMLAEIERNREESITRKEFLTFSEKTEENFQQVWQAIGELTRAQQRTEKRLDQLTQRMDQLTQRMDQLAEAQNKTETSLQKLIKRVDSLSKEVGGISHAVGYTLEDRSYPALKRILQQQFDITVEKLYRRNLVYTTGTDDFDEINIYGEGLKNGNKIYIIGESKSQFGIKNLRKFLSLLKRVKAHLQADILPLALAHHYHPATEAALQKEGIHYFWSFDLVEQ